MTEMSRFHCRNNMVLVRMIDLGKTPSGIAIPSISVQGKQFLVEAVGPEVEDLQIGDSVLMRGTHGVDYYEVPGEKNLIIIEENNVVLIIHPEEAA